VKIKRFVAQDMRTALAQIKEELGADAVIMSTKKIAEGVELMAAVDQNQESAPKEPVRELPDDTVSFKSQPVDSTNSSVEPPADNLAALLKRKVQLENAKIAAASDQVTSIAQTAKQKAVAPPSIEQQFKRFTERLGTNVEPTTDNVNDADDLNIDVSTAEHFSEPTQHNSVTPTADVVEINRMRDEMSSIRQLLEHQVAGLLWQDMAHRDPNRAVLVNRLQSMGISTQLAEQFSGYIAKDTSQENAWLEMKGLLSEQLNTTNNDIIRHGGVVSLVGPTGVGKTTTIAKLAARFSQVHGADSVALISTDTYRIAGFEQLSTYGKIIGCQVKLAKDASELDYLIQAFADKKLVLIDTAGMGQRDIRLSKYLSTLIANARVRIRNYLVLAANTQPQVMQENVERFKKIPLAGAIFTKLDESLSFGEIISTSIQNGLAIAYLTDGQRVPEDIKVANAEKLVTLADKMAIKYASKSASQFQPIQMTANG
jgi:flagellar biosynthesis protein FlhF